MGVLVDLIPQQQNKHSQQAYSNIRRKVPNVMKQTGFSKVIVEPAKKQHFWRKLSRNHRGSQVRFEINKKITSQVHFVKATFSFSGFLQNHVDVRKSHSS